MRTLLKTVLVGASLAATLPASALVVVAGSGDISTDDLTHANRVFRDGTASTWAAPKSFPGTLSGTYHYDLLNVSFAPNATQDVYYRISSVNPSFSPFVVAYANSFDPSNLGTNYLGDQGQSASGSFQVIVSSGGSLVIDFSQVAESLNGYSYTVEAFSDANGGENFGGATVPEPASWALMIAGFGLVGFAARRRRTAVAA